jgi:hypothetical protein
MYSFLTKTSKGWILTISTSFKPIQECVISETLYADKRTARKAAELLGAKAWNY